MPFDGKLRAKPSGVADALIRAKEYLVQHGWSSHGARGPGGEVCMAVAVSFTTRRAGYSGLPPNPLGFQRVLPYLLGACNLPVPADLSCLGVRLGTWNDAPGRTLDEVLAAYDRAIDAALIEEAAYAA